MGCDDEALSQQRAYYRGRAPEYDDWWQRRGRYDRGEEESREWHHQVASVDDALRSFDVKGDVLELAGGTGWWTERLAGPADRLTVVDAAPEALALNRERVGRQDVSYVIADLFDWRPERSYDVVFFSFWLSHVPRRRFSSFWSLVRASLRPCGRVFFIDNRRDDTASDAQTERDPYVVEYGSDLHRRRLGDGSEYLVVKVMYEADELGRSSRAKAGTHKSIPPDGSSSAPLDHADGVEALAHSIRPRPVRRPPAIGTTISRVGWARSTRIGFRC